ncbi:ABC transporter permease [Paenibacillus sp. Marseille-P2973]|uniref:ABC transporter permease n=1 Tax=Paenibacillus sp. Marseille-P2973 TaxID=1871032 RepID=UPI001B398F2B|nr:ABC transporter permease [Paenibacillus sp. Marseille-P2973]MBQ4898325.1 ABC transporter permease [Paenibacillus sp. Marseille-P2973]
MNPVFMAQWMKEKRSPLMVLLFCGLSIIATLLFGQSADSKLKIGAFPASGVEADTAEEWLEVLNANDAIEFIMMDERKARSEVNEGRTDAAIQLMEKDYRIIASIDNPNVQLVGQIVHSAFMEELQLRAAEQFSNDAKAFREGVESFLENPPLAVGVQTPDGKDLIEYDMNLQLLFTFTLFLACFTIGYKINSITMEKVSGIWSRMILSPVRKSQMYMGHLMYSSLIGFAQIVTVFLLFRYIAGFDLGGRFGMLLIVAALYTLTIVAFSMLLTGILRTPEQFNMVFPSVIPIMPLISGAYMPPGTITNQFLLLVSEVLPLKHAVDAMVEISIYDAGWPDVFLPLAKLSMIGVICMGVGINLMERRKG